MASTIFHHWLDQFRAWPKPRQRWGLGVLGAVAIVVLLGVGFAAGRGLPVSGNLQARVRQLQARNAALQDQVQGLQQQQQTGSTTLSALRASLASRDEELQKLRQEQAFYAKLIGLGSSRSGPGVHSLALAPVPGTNAWNFVVTLVNAAEKADAARGTLTLDVEGVRNGKLATAGWASLAAPGTQDGIPFAFKFFQQLRGSFMLPKDFVPNRVMVTLHPQGGSPVTRKIEWNEALANQHDAILGTP